MSLRLDPEIAAILAAAGEAGRRPAVPPPGNVFALRELTDASLAAVLARMPDAPDVDMTACSAEARDGVAIPLRWYARRDSRGGPAVIYVHGGGMVCGSAAGYDPLIRHYVQQTGVSFLSVDYRLAPEHVGVGLARDVFAALEWLIAQRTALDVETGRIAVMGDSGGGGVAVGAAIMARDHGIGLARQILVYPMLDDRNIAPDRFLAPTAFWSYEFNHMAWAAVLGDAIGTAEASPYLAPARLADFSGLPRAYLEVGELDIFRDECVSYARQLFSAGISCELHVHPGAPHGYDLMSLSTSLSQRVMADRIRVIASL